MSPTRLYLLLFVICSVIINGTYYALPELRRRDSTHDSDGKHEFSLQEKVQKIIYYKTHKTGSTTVGSILFRFGAQHGLQFQRAKDRYYSFDEAIAPADITLHHHFQKYFSQMMEHYEQVVKGGVYLSILRNPTRRYLSHYHYFAQPNGISFEDYLSTAKFDNNMCKYIGMETAKNLDWFMKLAYDKFFFLITEKFDESLLLLKYKWGWSLQDILYISLNERCSGGSKGNNTMQRFDHKTLKCSPTFASLNAEQLEIMADNNALDYELYNRAYEDLNKQLQAQPQQFWDELVTYKNMLKNLKQLCSSNETATEGCKGFLLTDEQYESMIDSNGYAKWYHRVNVQ